MNCLHKKQLMQSILDIWIGVNILQQSFTQFIFDSLIMEYLLYHCFFQGWTVVQSNIRDILIQLTIQISQSHSYKTCSPLPSIYFDFVQPNQSFICQSHKIFNNSMMSIQFQIIWIRFKLLQLSLFPKILINKKQASLGYIVLHFNYNQYIHLNHQNQDYQCQLSYIIRRNQIQRDELYIEFMEHIIYSIFQQMSRMITQTRQLQSDPILQTTIRNIAFNRTDFNSMEVQKWNQRTEQRQSRLLKAICKKITMQERQNIRMMANNQAREQYSKLKSKLRKNMSKPSIQRIMGEKDDKINEGLSKLMKVKTETVDLGVKYRNKIRMKLNMCTQAQCIEDQKQIYMKWYDSQINSPINSPIYKKVNYLLQQVAKKDRETKVKPSTSSNQQINPYEHGSYRRIKRKNNKQNKTNFKKHTNW